MADSSQEDLSERVGRDEDRSDQSKHPDIQVQLSVFFTSFRKENLCSTARANASLALESEIDEDGAVCLASFTIASRNCSCSSCDRTCFQPLRSMHRFISSNTCMGYPG